MKPGWLYVLALAALLMLAYLAYLMMPTPPAPVLDQSRTKMTKNGLYSISIEPEGTEVRQGELHSWIVTVATADGQPVNDAWIKFDGGMPEHNHGLPTAPEATEKLDGGRYRIEGVKFSMSGWWELRIEVSAQHGSDVVTFNLVL